MKDKISMISILGMFFAVSILSVNVSAYEKTITINLLVQGLDPVQRTEFYYGYPINNTVFTNYDVHFYDVNIFPYEEPSGNGDGSFRAEISSENNEVLFEENFEPNFMILSNPPTETNLTMVTLSFPYSQKSKYLRVYYQGREMLSIIISERLCNNDSRCGETENFLSCHSDCPFYANDSLCIEIKYHFNTSLEYWEDHYCDPDCYNDDDDCEKENCNDGIQNQNETGVDFGGECMEIRMLSVFSFREVLLYINHWINNRIDVENLLRIINKWKSSFSS